MWVMVNNSAALSLYVEWLNTVHNFFDVVSIRDSIISVGYLMVVFVPSATGNVRTSDSVIAAGLFDGGVYGVGVPHDRSSILHIY